MTNNAVMLQLRRGWIFLFVNICDYLWICVNMAVPYSQNGACHGIKNSNGYSNISCNYLWICEYRDYMKLWHTLIGGRDPYQKYESWTGILTFPYSQSVFNISNERTRGIWFMTWMFDIHNFQWYIHTHRYVILVPPPFLKPTPLSGVSPLLSRSSINFKGAAFPFLSIKLLWRGSLLIRYIGHSPSNLIVISEGEPLIVDDKIIPLLTWWSSLKGVSRPDRGMSQKKMPAYWEAAHDWCFLDCMCFDRRLSVKLPPHGQNPHGIFVGSSLHCFFLDVIMLNAICLLVQVSLFIHSCSYISMWKRSTTWYSAIKMMLRELQFCSLNASYVPKPLLWLNAFLCCAMRVLSTLKVDPMYMSLLLEQTIL